MINRKLVKLTKNQYFVFNDGICVTFGGVDWVKSKAKNFGFHEIDLAIKTMEENGDDVADFGLFGSLITTQNFFDADLGFDLKDLGWNTQR